MSEQHCKSILIVEDDQSIRETMIEMLESEGYNTYSAINGKDALNLLRDEIPKPCLVLLDMMMPIMNGRQFLDEMMKDAVLAPIPVLIVSAIADPSNTKGSVGFLKKPVDIDAVLSTVSRYCC
jgi:CheY-like chemotaxis protein